MKYLILVAALSLAAQARPSASGTTHSGHGRVYNGSLSGSHGGQLRGTGGHVVVPGQGAARAGTYTGTGAKGGTYQSQGANVITRQGGFHQNKGSWNGQNSSGSFDSSGSWKAGQGGQSSTSATATSKKTGQTYSLDSNTQYDPNAGGSTTITTGNGTSKTVLYPAKTAP
ncbi:MAG: hypothetical protein KF760_26960 [Candidatus Eremiobacteraeota bacterium]|nr:hypothetical protein [Candidatus Eremiobacteraeota bacterium]MCW5869619.1 hypothetical protein [Candidatus Eremiobacteraeota bacterium]